MVWKRGRWMGQHGTDSGNNAQGWNAKEEMDRKEEPRWRIFWKLASLPAYTPQNIKLKQKPWKQQQPILKSALMLLPKLFSLRMPCPSCRPSSQTGTLITTTCLLLSLLHFIEAMRSPCNGFPPIATCMATRLLTLWQRTQQRSKWIGPPATIFKAKQHSMWRHKHPWFTKDDPYGLLTRREQVTAFRLRTGHNCLNYNLYSKLCIAQTE